MYMKHASLRYTTHFSNLNCS